MPKTLTAAQSIRRGTHVIIITPENFEQFIADVAEPALCRDDCAYVEWVAKEIKREVFRRLKPYLRKVV